MPGSVDKNDIRAIFQGIMKPSTITEIYGYHDGLAYRMLETAIGSGWVHKKGEKYWPDDEVIAEGIENTQKEIAKWKEVLASRKKQQRIFARLNKR